MVCVSEMYVAFSYVSSSTGFHKSYYMVSMGVSSWWPNCMYFISNNIFARYVNRWIPLGKAFSGISFVEIFLKDFIDKQIILPIYSLV